MKTQKRVYYAFRSRPSKIKKGGKHTKKTAAKGQLFSDDNPETTVHGYGFSNDKIAKHTLDDLEYRDIDYQFQVINTMYHRGLTVLKRTKDKNKKHDISQAISRYKKWLDDYKSNNRSEKEQRPYLTPKQLDQLEFLAEYYKISEKARGLEKPTKSDKGFKVIWETSTNKGGANGDKKRLRNMPIKASVPDGQTWDKHRNQYLTRRLSMVKNAKDDLYYTSGKHKGLPTKLHVNMMMWAYSPDSKKVLKNIDSYKKKIIELGG